MSTDRVLLIDDEVEYVETLAERLRARGLEVEVATNGEDGVEKSKNAVFHAVILDFSMPGMNGIETLKALREQNPDIQVMLLSGQATIKRESFAALEQAAEFLFNNADLQIVIEGHTDSRGTYETNLTLSQRRADAVMKYLVVNHGIDPKRLKAMGMGPTHPIASNNTTEGRALNRRIEFQLQEPAVSQ